MEWNYFETIGIVGFLVLVIQLLVFRWESRSNSAWRGVRVPVTLRQVLWEWATYVRTAASHVLILLNTREAINAWSGVRKDYSIVDRSHCCESKGEIT
jgi:hypothetical protein